MNPSRTEHKSGRWIAVSLIVFLAAIAIYAAAGMIASARDAAKPRREVQLPLVEVTDIKTVPQHYTVTEEGFLRPRAEIDVIPEVSGRIVEVAPQLEPGGRFSKGELLYRIDPRTFEADLARAKADLTAAKAEVESAKAQNDRQTRLEGIGAAARVSLEQASTGYATARARLGQSEAALITAQKRLDDTAVRAPFAAAVISETVALGRYVQPGQATATIYDTGAGEIVLGLIPSDARAVRRAVEETDGAAEVTITPSRASASDSILKGRVKRFGSAVDGRSRTVPVVVEVPEAFDQADRAYANDFVTVALPGYSDEQLYAVPNGAVREERFIWTLTANTELHAVEITQLKRDGAQTLIRSDEDIDGKPVVLTALTEEAEGMKVDVRRAGEQETLR